MKKILLLTIAALMVAPQLGLAQDANESTAAPHSFKTGHSDSKPRFLPIEVQTYSAGWHSFIGGYTYQGLPLTSDQDFERVIDPLGDSAASQMLRSAGEERGWGGGLLWGGILVEAAGWVDFTVVMANLGNDTDTTPDIWPSLGLILGGTGVWVIGLSKEADANNDRYNAVTRYNYVVQNPQSSTWMIVPDLKSRGLSLALRF